MIRETTEKTVEMYCAKCDTEFDVARQPVMPDTVGCPCCGKHMNCRTDGAPKNDHDEQVRLFVEVDEAGEDDWD